MLAEEILDRLDIVPLEKLKIHEQTIEANTKALRESMLNLGRIVDPLIVEKSHYVVLDGNHRRQVLEDLKCENAICQVVDYSDPEIKVLGWYLAMKGTSLAQKHKLGGELVDKETGIGALNKLEACTLLAEKRGGKDEFRIFPSSGRKLDDVVEDQKKLFSRMPANWLGDENAENSMLYIEDERSQMFIDRGYSVFFRRPYTKEEIIREATAGRPLPPKSTRHTIPNRIIRLNFHLGYLNEPKDTALNILSEIVKRRVKFHSARHYTESVIVLY